MKRTRRSSGAAKVSSCDDMRVKNKEIRSRRHRKEQKVKDAARELRAKYGEGKTTAPADKTAVKKPPAAKPAAKKESAPKKEAAPRKETAPKAAAPKKTAAPKAKKAEP